MKHADHIALIRGGVERRGTRWLELGAGDGAFTLALADLLGPGGSILAVDSDRWALAELAARLASRFPELALTTLVADFETGLPTGPFDGVLAANSLHFVADQVAVLRASTRRSCRAARSCSSSTTPSTATRTSRTPSPSTAWPSLATAAGFTQPRLLHRVPSRFLGAIYGAVASRPGFERRLGRPWQRDALGLDARTACYTPALTATTERSRSGTTMERARDGASRAGTTDAKVAREPCGWRPIARREDAGAGRPR